MAGLSGMLRQAVRLVEVMRAYLRFADGQRLDVLCLDVDDRVLVLQLAFYQ